MAAIEKHGEYSFRLTVSCGYDKNGKQVVKRETINKQLDEAQRQWVLFKDKVQNGVFLEYLILLKNPVHYLKKHPSLALLLLPGKMPLKL